MIFAGGASLRRHWNAGRAQQALEANAWDWVVLQEQSTLPVKNRARYHDNVRMFEAAIRASGARTALYLVWTRRASPEAQDLLDAAADGIAAELGALVVPVGPAWRIALRADPALKLYADDGSHPTVAGTYLAACTFAAHLVGVTVGGFAVADRLKLDREVAVRLHAAAREAARP
jgi:hypothetical protein